MWDSQLPEIYAGNFTMRLPTDGDKVLTEIAPYLFSGLKMYNFFKDTGIQFFGDSNIEFDFDYSTDSNNPFKSDDEINYNAVVYRMFLNEWLPLSLDHRRTLIKVSI